MKTEIAIHWDSIGYPRYWRPRIARRTNGNGWHMRWWHVRVLTGPSIITGL